MKRSFWLAFLGALLAQSSVAAHSATCLLVVEEEAGSLAIVDLEGKLRKRLPLGERPREIEVTPDRRTAYVSMFGITDYDSQLGKPGRLIAKIDLLRGERVDDLELPGDLRAPHGVKLRPPGHRELFVNSEVGGEAMLVYDRATGKLPRQFPLPPGTHNFVFSSDGSSLFSFAGAKGVAKIDAVTGKILASRDLGSPIRGVMVSQRGTVMASGKGAIFELRAADLADVRIRPAPVGGQLVYADELSDGTLLAPSILEGGVALLPANGAASHFVKTGKTAIRVLRGPDGLAYVANVQDRHVSVLNGHGALVRSIEGWPRPTVLLSVPAREDEIAQRTA